MDIFGKGAKAQVKVLTEALAIERARNDELMAQVLAMSDPRAYRIAHPKEVVETLEFQSPAHIKRPGDRRPSPDSVVRTLRDLKRSEPKPEEPAA